MDQVFRIYIILMSVCAVISVEIDASESDTEQINHLIGYDCKGSDQSISKIDISEIPNCKDNVNMEVNTDTFVQIIQTKEYLPVYYRSCLVSITRVVYTCTWDQEVSLVAGSHYSYIHPLGLNECRDIHREKSWKWKDIVIEGLKINSTKTISVTLAGSVDSAGWCKNGGTYSDNGGTFQSVFVLGTVNILLTDGMGDIIRNEEKVILTSSKVSCIDRDGYCFDAIIGDLVWDRVNEKECDNDGVDVLYEGKVEILSTGTGDNIEKQLIVDNGDTIMALKMLKVKRFCQLYVTETEHKRILIVNRTGNGYIFDQRDKMYSKNIDLTAYINSKFLYVTANIFKNTRSMHAAIEKESCETRRKVLENRLALARIDPAYIGQLIGEETGVYGRVMGEVLYIIRCAPTVVEPRYTSECYQEIPVTHNNVSKFLSPVTRMIVPKGNEVECLSVLPVMHKFGNHWIGRSPKPFLTTSPMQLDPNTHNMEWKQNNMLTISLGGLYSTSDMEALQKQFLFPSVRDAITTNLAIRANGHNDEVDFGNVFNSDDITSLSEKIAMSMTPGMLMYAAAGGALFATLCAFGILKCVISTCANCRTIHTVNKENSSPFKYLWYLAGCVDALTHMIMNPLVNILVKTENNVPTAPADVEMGTIRPAPLLIPPGPYYDANIKLDGMRRGGGAFEF